VEALPTPPAIFSNCSGVSSLPLPLFSLMVFLLFGVCVACFPSSGLMSPKLTACGSRGGPVRPKDSRIAWLRPCVRRSRPSSDCPLTVGQTTRAGRGTGESPPGAAAAAGPPRTRVSVGGAAGTATDTAGNLLQLLGGQFSVFVFVVAHVMLFLRGSGFSSRLRAWCHAACGPGDRCCLPFRRSGTARLSTPSVS